MARKPDIQYIQMYSYGSTAHKLSPRTQYRKEPYQLPEQKRRQQKAKQKLLDPLSVCAIVVACAMLIAMVIGMCRVGELTGRCQELEKYIDQLHEQRADLQKTYESTYDLAEVEQRARQMGLVYGNEVFHVQMGAADPAVEQEPGFAGKLSALFDELFAKAPQ